jgi:hypothetical protein
MEETLPFLDLAKIPAGANAMQMNHDGVAMNCSSSRPCPFYIPIGAVRYVHEDNTDSLPRLDTLSLTGGKASGAIIHTPVTLTAHGLHTCAAVVISGAKGYGMYHAGSGVIDDGVLKKLLSQIGDASSLKAIYAVPADYDENYRNEANKLLAAEIESKNLIVLANVGGSFAVNELGIVGCP